MSCSWVVLVLFDTRLLYNLTGEGQMINGHKVHQHPKYVEVMVVEDSGYVLTQAMVKWPMMTSTLTTSGLFLSSFSLSPLTS